MFADLKQFVPSSVCLKCDGCCRFKEADSSWRPGISDEEKKAAAAPSLPDKIFGPHVVDDGGRIRTTPCGTSFICHFLNSKDNTCGIYHARPFECRLYPFLFVREKDRMAVYVHLNCPFVQEHWRTERYKDYVRELKEFFMRPETLGFLNRNPDLAGDYSAYYKELDYVFDIPAG